MNRLRTDYAPVPTDSEWMPFPGGELEGRRPKALCSECRAQANRLAAGEWPATSPALCFQCYRAELERNRKLKAAADLDTASEARFQYALPFEPVNTSKLAQLRIERERVGDTARLGTGRFVEKRRRAQIQARHQLAQIFQGLKQRRMVNLGDRNTAGRDLDEATHAAELQLPESWVPFVVSR